MLVAWNDINRTFNQLEALRRRVARSFADYDEGGGPDDAVFAAWAPSGPRVAVEEGEQSYVIRALVPGMGPSDVEVKVNPDELVIQGRRAIQAPEGYRPLRTERRACEFTRSIGLPATVDVDAVTASVKNGVLTVTLPKTPERKPRVIQVAAD